MPLALQLRFGFIGAAIDVTDRRRAEAAMKAGAVDYVLFQNEASLREALARALVECQSNSRPAKRDESAGAKLARLTHLAGGRAEGLPHVQAQGR